MCVWVWVGVCVRERERERERERNDCWIKSEKGHFIVYRKKTGYISVSSFCNAQLKTFCTSKTFQDVVPYLDRCRKNECDQIGRFLKVLSDKFSSKSNQNVYKLFRLHWKRKHFCRNCCKDFWATFWKIGLLFISPSDHTVCMPIIGMSSSTSFLVSFSPEWTHMNLFCLSQIDGNYLSINQSWYSFCIQKHAEGININISNCQPQVRFSIMEKRFFHSIWKKERSEEIKRCSIVEL